MREMTIEEKQFIIEGFIKEEEANGSGKAARKLEELKQDVTILERLDLEELCSYIGSIVGSTAWHNGYTYALRERKEEEAARGVKPAE